MQTIKVLLIDDQLENLRSMVQVFKKHKPDYHILQINNPEKAVDIAKQERPDLIITDWEMPGLNGLDFTRAMKEDSSTRDIPIIMATGVKMSSHDLKNALDAGAIDYIRKPIDSIELLARCSSALKVTEYFKDIIKLKNNELTENALMLVKSKQSCIDIAKDLNRLKNELEQEKHTLASSFDCLIEELEEKIREDGWYKFQLAFTEVHKDFNKNLLQRHPLLTPAELRLCSLLRLGMSSKDIAIIMYQSPDSIKVARSRLRKKLEMENDMNLETYLSLF